MDTDVPRRCVRLDGIRAASVRNVTNAGIVIRESPAYPFPDAHAHGAEAIDEPTYDVAFRTKGE